MSAPESIANAGIDSVPPPSSTHHTHTDNEPLPGAKGASSAAPDYSPSTIENAPESALRGEGDEQLPSFHETSGHTMGASQAAHHNATGAESTTGAAATGTKPKIGDKLKGQCRLRLATFISS